MWNFRKDRRAHRWWSSRLDVKELKQKHAFSSLCKGLKELTGSHPASNSAAWGSHLTDATLWLWQGILLPDLVPAWDKGIHRLPVCFWIISVSTGSWTAMGCKQRQQTETPEDRGHLALGELGALTTDSVECASVCAFGQHFLCPCSGGCFPHSRCNSPTGCINRWATYPSQQHTGFTQMSLTEAFPSRPFPSCRKKFDPVSQGQQ